MRDLSTTATAHDPERIPQAMLWAGLIAWACVSTASIARALSFERLAWWSMGSAVFLVSFCLARKAAQSRQALLALQSIAAIGMAAVMCNGYEGFLLVLVAAQLGCLGQASIAVPWIIVQTMVLAGAIAFEWNARSALLLAPPYLGLQVLMFVAMRSYAKERALRIELESAHTTVLDLQRQLTERTRLAERLRMTQELHDTFGHRLTALSLNLEAAMHESGARARDSLVTAQSLVGVLLDEIKAFVRSLQDDQPIDLPGELHKLARDLPRPRIHLDCPAGVSVSDPRAGRALLRCAQEIVTNAIRHGGAGNLWIQVGRHANTLRLVARDDGDVVTDFRDGFGLTGMRRRLRELGGSLTTEPLAAGGVEVRAELPLSETQKA